MFVASAGGGRDVLLGAVAATGATGQQDHDSVAHALAVFGCEARADGRGYNVPRAWLK
ncbi:hypothetical protein NFJ02_34g85150 [Pycnococcus provasolii]